MPRSLRLLAFALGCALVPGAPSRGDTGAPARSWRGLNADRLSGGLFAALEEAGVFGAPAAPGRAAADGGPAKGRPPAVLDARVGVNVPLGEDPAALPVGQRAQAEPHVARSLTNPDLLLATFQEGRFADGGAAGLGYSISRDGGLTWTRALVPELTTATGGRYTRATDPVAAAGPQGDLYLQSLVSTRGAFELGAVVVSRSTDGGATWSAPSTVFESTTAQLSPDKNWLAVNTNAGSPAFGRLVATWTNFNRNAAGAATSSPIVAAVSDDRGATWSTPAVITTPTASNQGAQPVFLPDGSLVVVYSAFLNPQDASIFSIECKRSTDGGRTFSDAATTIAGSVNGYVDPVLRAGVFLTSATAARSTGDLFVTYVGRVAGSPRVLVTRSTNRCATWTAPVAVSDQPAGVAVLNPTIAASPDGQTVVVLFMDKRHAADGRNFVDHYAAWSLDGGATWRPNVRLTELSSDLRLGTPTSNGIMLGDYLGLAAPVARDQPAVAVWCDTRTGNVDPFAVRFTPSAAPDFAAWSAARFNRPIAAFDDADQDGITNAGEYFDGTNPLAPDFGDNLVSYRIADNTTIVARPLRQGTAGAAGLRVHDLVTGVIGDFAMQPQLAIDAGNVVVSNVPPADLPAIPLPEGLEWVGVKLPSQAPLQVSPTQMTVTDGIAHLLVSPVGPATALRTDSRMVNLSARGHVTAGAGQMILGFVLDGSKSVLVRAAGPALQPLGVSGALANPVLTLAAPASDLLRVNDDWQQADATLFARLGAFAFPPNSRDAALALQLGPQTYTVIASGATNGTGIALVEAYDADPDPGAPGNPRLLNLSARADVGTGSNALVAGFVITGSQPRRVLLRAAGPSLADVGVTGALADPVLTLFRGDAAIATNDDWEVGRSGPAVAATSRRVGAFALRAASLDAALLTTLAPGAYTAMVTGRDSGTGIALVEIYDAD